MCGCNLHPISQTPVPKPAPGQTLDPSQLPRGLSHSIQLKPQLLLEGQVQAQGPGLGAGTEVVGAGAFTKYGNSGDWDETTDPLIAGQQSALGLSVQGISQEQLTTLKTRMEATKQTLQQAQAASTDAQRATLLQGMTGDHLTGDLLTATLWGYFAALQSHGAIASSQAHMIDRPALSYGLFHAQVRPNKLYGIVTTGITFQGLNMDIGHVRHIRWVKNDDPQAAINHKPELTANGKTAAQNRWIAYNKMRGQYASAMEHAVPEQFWVDKSQCRYVDEAGQTHNPTLADCAQGVSAVKALAIAQAEGQRIYTITAENAATALPNLPVGGSVGDEIRSAVQAGKEVTVHERAINAHGFSGYGYIVTDPDTGAGGYIIEGKGNGGWLPPLQLSSTGVAWYAGGAQGVSFTALAIILGALLGPAAPLLGILGTILVAILMIFVFLLIQLVVFELATSGMSAEELSCYNGGFGYVGAFAALVANILFAVTRAPSSIVSTLMTAILGIPAIIAGGEYPSTDRPSCVKK